MLPIKPWYLSTTIWASIITIITPLAYLFGVPIGLINNNEIADAIIQIITAFSGFLAIVGRIKAKHIIR